MKANPWGSGQEAAGGKASLFLVCMKLLFEHWAHCVGMRYDSWGLSGWGHIWWKKYSWCQPPNQKTGSKKASSGGRLILWVMFLFVLFVLSPKFLKLKKKVLKILFWLSAVPLVPKREYVHSWAEVSKGEQWLPEATVKVLAVIKENPKGRLHLRGQRATWVASYLLSNANSLDRDFLTALWTCH